MNKQLVKGFEILRIVLSALGFYLAYSETSHTQALFWIIALVIIPLSGLTGLESLLFSSAAAKQKGREVSPYQIQSAMNNLAVAITAIIILILNWGAQAKITIIAVSLVFFLLSAVQHAREAIQLKQQQSEKQKIHWQRVILSIILCAAIAPLLYPFFSL
jgi:hypothetical protein